MTSTQTDGGVLPQDLAALSRLHLQAPM